jgi:hypothetical protein
MQKEAQNCRHSGRSRRSGRVFAEIERARLEKPAKERVRPRLLDFEHVEMRAIDLKELEDREYKDALFFRTQVYLSLLNLEGVS